MPVGNGGLLGALVSSSAARCSAEPSSAQWAPAAARIVCVACSNAASARHSLGSLGSLSVAWRARRSSSWTVENTGGADEGRHQGRIMSRHQPPSAAISRHQPTCTVEHASCGISRSPSSRRRSVASIALFGFRVGSERVDKWIMSR